MIEESHSQDDPFTIKGHWWLPGSSHKVAGDLIYDVGEMTLVLCQSCFDIWYPLGSRSWKTDITRRLSWRSVIG